MVPRYAHDLCDGAKKYNIYTSLSLQNSLWTSAFTCETPNCWLCVYVVKKDRAILLTKCFKKSGNVATLKLLYLIIFLHSLLSCILPFLSHSFSCEYCTHLTAPLIISLSELFRKRYLINYSLVDFLRFMLRFPAGIILAVDTRTPTDKQTITSYLTRNIIPVLSGHRYYDTIMYVYGGIIAKHAITRPLGKHERFFSLLREDSKARSTCTWSTATMPLHYYHPLRFPLFDWSRGSSVWGNLPLPFCHATSSYYLAVRLSFPPLKPRLRRAQRSVPSQHGFLLSPLLRPFLWRTWQPSGGSC